MREEAAGATPLAAWIAALVLFLATLAGVYLLPIRSLVDRVLADDYRAAARAVLIPEASPNSAHERLVVVIGDSLARCAFEESAQSIVRLRSGQAARIVLLAGGGTRLERLGGTMALVDRKPDLLLIQDDLLLPIAPAVASLAEVIGEAATLVKHAGRRLVIGAEVFPKCLRTAQTDTQRWQHLRAKRKDDLERKVRDINLMYDKTEVDTNARKFVTQALLERVPTALISIARAPSLESRTGNVARWRTQVVTPFASRLALSRWQVDAIGSDDDYSDYAHLNGAGGAKFAALLAPRLEAFLAEGR